jgi:uncharacterized repeat protein (TIGR01451 family)
LNPKYVPKIKRKAPHLCQKNIQVMKIKLISTRLLPLFVVFFCYTFSGLQAQGFIKKIPYAYNLGGRSHSIFENNDGSFTLTASNLYYPNTEAVLDWFQFNTLGDSIGIKKSSATYYTIDSNIQPGYLNPYSFYQLKSGDWLNLISNENVVTISKLNTDSLVSWTTQFTINDWQNVSAFIGFVNDAGDIFVRGSTSTPQPSGNWPPYKGGFVAKISSNGTFLWRKNHQTESGSVYTSKLVPTPDGGCVFFNNNGNQNFGLLNEIIKLDENGEQVWLSSYPSNGFNLHDVFENALDINASSELFFSVGKGIPNTQTENVYINKLAPNGSLINQVDIHEALGEDLSNLLAVKLVKSLANGGFFAIIQVHITNPWLYKYYLVKIHEDGSVDWKKDLNLLTNALTLTCSDSKELPNGDLVIYGSLNDLYFIKISADGQIYPNSIVGKVARDSTFNCIADANDPVLKNWAVSATVNGLTQYASSDANGNYVINDVNNGNCQVVLTPQNYLWNPCLDTVSFILNSQVPQTDTVDFVVQALYDCPVMQVDISTPVLRRCFSTNYHLQYCNSGNQTAQPTFVGVQLDALLSIDSASVPFTQNGNEYLFDIGAVSPGECGSFVIYTYLDCAADLGQTFCTTAHIWPDTLCAQNLPNWSGAQIEVSGVCEGDSVLFTIKNTGSGPSQSLDFVIVDDHVITRQGPFSLLAGDFLTQMVVADGSTWRLAAQQEPGFPFGNNMPSVAVEGCNVLGGNPSLGMVNLFPNNSGDPFEDTDCHAVVGSYDPNDKAAFPEGVDNEHFIEQNQAIDYQIRFQNTGTDTAFTVVVRDTLDAWLDPASVRLGASSHPYTYTLSGEGILIFTFHPIALPDSNVNEVASHGFLKFNVAQKRDVPLGSRIENRAGIYFDFNAAVMTNTVFHTIGKDFLPVSTKNTAPLPVLNIWPNPATTETIVSLKQQNFVGKTLIIRDLLGRIVSETPVNQSNTTIRRNGLSSGVYCIELRDKHGIWAVGKVIWE